MTARSANDDKGLLTTVAFCEGAMLLLHVLWIKYNLALHHSATGLIKQRLGFLLQNKAQIMKSC
jgi:hypothetical protein